MKKLKTFKSFLNESFSDKIAYIEAVNILKTLHEFSNKIKFKTENVNGYENIVYDDENLITKECLDKLKDRRFWNTEFTSTIGKFSNNRINIKFEKLAQDILNIKDFDKKDWKPGNY
jgi:hypothetical protein